MLVLAITRTVHNQYNNRPEQACPYTIARTIDIQLHNRLDHACLCDLQDNLYSMCK